MSLKIREFSQKTGLTTYTLRYYEKIGLLQPERDNANHRDYNENDLDWIDLLQKLKSTGMPLKDIKEFSNLVLTGDNTISQSIKILEKHQEKVIEQLTEFNDCLDKVNFKIKYYRGVLKSNIRET
ncbi:MerR family transcriptional regulator [Halocella sp. SP3-1]|nr:MerR family transcriptional regulator [Halocella sp. SP3-1]